MAASFDQTSNHLHFRSSSPPLHPNNYHFSAPYSRFHHDPLHTQMTSSSAIAAAPREAERVPLAVHGVVSSKKKASKRKKPCTSKRSRTTFIAADVADFRQMVQLVTGAKFCDSIVTSTILLGPEPQRVACGGRSYKVGNSMVAGFSPTARLETRTFPEQQQAAVGWFGPPPAVVAERGVGDVGSVFDWGSTFHTLES